MAEYIALPDPAESITAEFSKSVKEIVWRCYGSYEIGRELPYCLWPIDSTHACNTGIANKMRYIWVSRTNRYQHLHYHQKWRFF
jgi:hypothetical protein